MVCCLWFVVYCVLIVRYRCCLSCVACFLFVFVLFVGLVLIVDC